MKDLEEKYGKHIKEAEFAAWWGAGKLIKFILILLAISIPISFIGYVSNWFGTAAQVAQQEFNPAALLDKYEWFKDVAAQLDKKQADISMFESRMSAIPGNYVDWDRTDKETFALWQSELLGVRSSYNTLAAEYNAQMAKFNWRFCNVGTLPEGASQILPREYRRYEQ